MGRRAIIFANIGSRDVKYSPGGSESSVEDKATLASSRRLGRFLSDNYEELKGCIELPIIEKGIGHIGSLGYKYPEVLQRAKNAPTVGLFCTDQQNERYREGDTIEFAEIVRKKLPEAFPNRKNHKGIRLNDKGSVTIRAIEEHDPSRYDDMYSFYRGFFEDGDGWILDEWLCFVLTSGGTPAMNAALILQAIQHFGESCVQVHVPREDEASELRIGEEMVRAATERRFGEALESLQFRAAAKILESTSREDHRAHACHYAKHRLAFDFRGALAHCQAAIRAAHGDTKRLLERHERSTRRLAQGRLDWSNRLLFIEELFYNLEVKVYLDEYVDALGRVWRLQEALLGWIVRSETGIETDDDRALEEQEASTVPGLWAYMREKSPERAPKINRYSLTLISGYLTKPEAGLSEERRTEIAKVRNVANKLNKLSDLRNKTIIAHGFEGVSEEDIEARYGQASLVEDVRSMVTAALEIDLSSNPFFGLARLLRF